MSFLRLSLPLFFVAALHARALSPTAWTDSGHDSSWSDSANWSAGVPSAASAVTIGVQPSGSIIGVDTGALENPIGSLTFGASLSGSLTLTNAGVEHLAVAAGIANNSAFDLELALPLELSTPQEIATGGGLLLSSGLSLNAAVEVEGAEVLTLGAGTQTVLTIAPDSFGHFTGGGTLDYAGSNLVFDFSQSVTTGSAWDLVETATAGSAFASVSFSGGAYDGALTETSPGVWEGTVGGTDWSYTEATGILAAVPEPGAGALLICGLAGVGGSRRRRAVRI